MADMNPDKITELINQIKNTDYAGKAELIAALQSLIAKMGIAKSADEMLLKSAVDDTGKVISQAITFYIGAGKEEPQASDIAGRLRQVLLSESIRQVKSSGMRDKAATLARFEKMYNEIEASLAKSATYTESNPEFEELREAIRDGPGSVYKKKVQNDLVSALEAREGTAPAQWDEFEVAKSLIETSGGSEEFRAKQIEILTKRYEDELEKAQQDSLPDAVKKNIGILESATEEIVRKAESPEEAGDAITKLLRAAFDKFAE